MTTNTEQWYGQQVGTNSDPLVDGGIGNAIILRSFEFTANPEILKKVKPNKQELFNNHASQIRMFLWKDGLEPIDVEPRIVVSDKKDSYRIFVGCKPKAGIALMEKPQTLQDLTKQNGPNTSDTGKNPE
jgi:hypothetical protein